MCPPALDPPSHFLPEDCETRTLGIAFFDLSRFGEWASADSDEAAAGFLQRFYCLSAEHLCPVGGRIVKFIGDAGLAVFAPEDAEPVILALVALARELRATAARDHNLDTYLNINVHVGPVLAGSFGPPGKERFDVLGKSVNVAARLGRRGVVLSPQAFRCLGPDVRQQFEKRQAPVTYAYRW